MSKQYLEAKPEEQSIAPSTFFNFRLPKKKYRVRCNNCEFGRSKKKPDGGGDHPMLTRGWEVVSPTAVKIKQGSDGELKEVSIQGLEVNDWLTLNAKSKSFVIKDSEKLGVEPPDDELPNCQQYIGKEMDVILGTNVVEQKDEETGEPITDSKGNPVVKYYHQIIEKLD